MNGATYRKLTSELCELTAEYDCGGPSYFHFLSGIKPHQARFAGCFHTAPLGRPRTSRKPLSGQDVEQHLPSGGLRHSVGRQSLTQSVFPPSVEVPRVQSGRDIDLLVGVVLELLQEWPSAFRSGKAA